MYVPRESKDRLTGQLQGAQWAGDAVDCSTWAFQRRMQSDEALFWSEWAGRERVAQIGALGVAEAGS